MSANSSIESPGCEPSTNALVACRGCGGTLFREEQYPAVLYWQCRITVDATVVDYPRTPEIAGDPPVTQYECLECGRTYASVSELLDATFTNTATDKRFVRDGKDAEVGLPRPT